ncbi:MAG: DUF4430 domain-containing protein [Oscillospiraceae bacterium]|nr:DUF4430 domain-containing protein [Oscillospiraceae bacterium]
MKTRIFAFIICTAMAVCMAGCSDKDTSSKANSDVSSDNLLVSSQATDNTVLGEGDTSFVFEVTGTDGNTASFTINTNEKTVGDALSKLGLIEGDDTEFGLYVKTVNGTTLDFDKDGKYWAFYIDGEYAMTGVDSTDIDETSVYEFRAE